MNPEGTVWRTDLLEYLCGVDRRGSLLWVDAVLDPVHIFVVVDVENLVQFQTVRVVGFVAGAEGVLIVQHKGSEALLHDSWVEPFHSEDNGQTLLDSLEQR